MREIKFRAWDKELKRMWAMDELLTPIDWEDLSVLDHLLRDESFTYSFDFNDNEELSPDDLYLDYDPTDFVLLQYTNLKDRNGKEIYEGDLVQHFVSTPSERLYSKGPIREIRVIDGVIQGLPVSIIRELSEISLLDFRYDHTKKVGVEVGYEDLITYHTENCEVIGNIYENPENENKS